MKTKTGQGRVNDEPIDLHRWTILFKQVLVITRCFVYRVLNAPKISDVTHTNIAWCVLELQPLMPAAVNYVLSKERRLPRWPSLQLTTKHPTGRDLASCHKPASFWSQAWFTTVNGSNAQEHHTGLKRHKGERMKTEFHLHEVIRTVVLTVTLC